MSDPAPVVCDFADTFGHCSRYSCEYLQYVETFVYFSHKLVTIPPPTWINTCHRNGVNCLGTFIVEPGTKEAECILQEDGLGSFWVAHQLALIAEKYGFDGWLVNIEESFPLLSWSVEKMEGFLRQLRQEVGIKSRVVWYDALTTLNFVWYQNTLNSLNLSFARAAGSILTDYAWNPQLANSARHLAEASGLGVGNVYFGIDVWAQNIQTGRNRRVTFPVKGGGGTGTGLGLRKLKELGLNAGIFAPGWSFEHFSSNCRAVERSVWLGEELPSDLVCECCPEDPHGVVPYKANGIVEHATRYPSGSRNFFHTDFTRGSTPTTDNAFFAHIGSQSILPLATKGLLVPSPGIDSQSGEVVYDGYVTGELSNSPARFLVSAHNFQGFGSQDRVSAVLRLFDLCISDSNTYSLSAAFRRSKTPAITLMLVVQWSEPYRHRIELPDGSGDVQSIEITLPTREDAITGISLQVVWKDIKLLPNGKTDLLDLFSITVRPSGSTLSCNITDLRLEQRGDAETKHSRLLWEVDVPGNEVTGASLATPFSSITGPCAYFIVEVDGQQAGRAYALEFAVVNAIEEACRLSGSVRIRIIAVGFDGRTLAATLETIDWPAADEDWVWVTRQVGNDHQLP